VEVREVGVEAGGFGDPQLLVDVEGMAEVGEGSDGVGEVEGGPAEAFQGAGFLQAVVDAASKGEGLLVICRRAVA
jgi:hypothetical protein